jgi:pyridoxine 5-phosphate synthase
MVRLSVNVNKVATLRNSRGGRDPKVLDAVQACLRAGAAGITVHPRADQRHITPQDVHDIARALEARRPAVEYNIEGDPRPDLLDLVDAVRPDQCTLVPVVPGEITSQAGWRSGPDAERLPRVIERLKSRGIRVSVFVDPAPIGWSSTPSRMPAPSRTARRAPAARSTNTLEPPRPPLALEWA